MKKTIFGLGGALLGLVIMAAPHTTFAYYGAIPDYNLPAYSVCNGRFDNSCITNQTNYLNASSWYGNSYGYNSYNSMPYYGSNVNYGYYPNTYPNYSYNYNPYGYQYQSNMMAYPMYQNYGYQNYGYNSYPNYQYQYQYQYQYHY